MGFVKICVILITVLRCDGISVWEQLEHIANRQNADSPSGNPQIMRRFGFGEVPSTILGAPSFPSHLPEAEPILPGHTLIKPSIGMLKSAVKFPHIDLENGAGVYGHIDNIGIRYGGKHDRVMYSGFRRMGGPTRLKYPTVASETEETDLKDFLRIIKSLRRDQALREEEPYNLGRNGMILILITHIPDQEKLSKPQSFSETKSHFEEFENQSE